MFELPSYVEEIMDRLEKNNYKAYLVGGAVRDFVMGIKPNDYDITTDCEPDIVEEIFKDKTTILVGKQFGTINIVSGGENVEVTTFRTEGKYTDGRRPEEVIYSKNIEEDLKRRDFTINALAYNQKEGIVDLFGGVSDIERKIIRTVGDSRTRFKEDYLRILRGVRFSSRLKFGIEKDTFKAMKEEANNLLKISSERVREEFFKMLLVEKPSDSIRLLDEIGALELLLPDIYKMKGFEQKNPNHSMDVYEHSLCVLDNTPDILELRLGALFHDIGKPTTFSVDENGVGHFYGHNERGVDIAKKILRKLNSSKRLISDVSDLIHYHMNSKDYIKTPGLKRLIRRFGEENIFNLTKLQIADIKCSSNREEDIEKIWTREEKILDILNKEEPYDRKHLDINGSDLIEVGYSEGREIGLILDYLFDLVIEDEKINKKDLLIHKALEKFPI